MDGMNTKKNVFIIGATNRPEQLDNALCRPGRLDTMVYVPLPDEASRKSILTAQLRKTPVAPDIDLDYIASKTHGFSGADLAYISQRAVKLAIKQSISARIDWEKEKESAGEDVKMIDEDEYEDPVPKLTKEHFEAAMAGARRSVPDSEIRRYESFAQQMKNSSGNAAGFFRFPEAGQEQAGANGFGDGGEDAGLYD